MGMPSGIPIVDTMIGFPHEGFGQYDFIRQQTKDLSSREEMQFPAEYMFKNVPKDLPTSDPVSVTLPEMDRFGIEIGLIGASDETGLSLERIFSDMPRVPFKDEVWPKFLSENARRVLKIGKQAGAAV
jgi:hypothetical protein